MTEKNTPHDISVADGGTTSAERLLAIGDSLSSEGNFEEAAKTFRQAALLLKNEARSYRLAWEDNGRSEIAYAHELITALNDWSAHNPMAAVHPPLLDPAVTWNDVRIYIRKLLGTPRFRALARYFEEATVALGWDWPNDMAANPLDTILAKYFGVNGHLWIDLRRADLRMVVDLFADGIIKEVRARQES